MMSTEAPASASFHDREKIGETASLGDDERDAGLLKVGDKPVGPGFGVEKCDRLVGAFDALGLHVPVEADGGLAGSLGLAAALETEDAHFEVGGCDLGGLK
jgi:hypothetical protein